MVIEPTGAQPSAGKTQPGTCEPTGGNPAGDTKPGSEEKPGDETKPSENPPPTPDSSPKSDACDQDCQEDLARNNANRRAP